MEPSLKSIIPQLSEVFSISPAALYERQRALVRAGLLKSKAGHGPGSGVKANAYSIALLVISLLATDSLSEVGERTKLFAGLKSRSGQCPLTGKTTFALAVAAVLDSPVLARKVTHITVTRVGHKAEPRARALAHIYWLDDHIFLEDNQPYEEDLASQSAFGPKAAKTKEPQHIVVRASLIVPLWFKEP